ncbi:PREDICTED: protein phosphatase 1 regulatory subunit 1B [Calidris pugnax]|uniref:protein phosphatase 1 regulatory subunit 1B n=1 Tax=Calidris pugnax TaxID=198806 RepID=UPI00071DC6D9|nr:PREDICTED: protein phosphatase 1 regulatory subunit 1B [Calidris pugnax]
MLFQLSEHSSPEDESLPYQRASGEGCLLKPKRTNPCAYTPPSLKAMQRIVQSHLESGPAGGDSSDGEPDDGENELARACDPDSALEPGEGTWDGGRGLLEAGGVGEGLVAIAALC